MTLPNNLTVPVAYEFEGITMCPSCALRASVVGLFLAGARNRMTSMEEVIATMALMQVERGADICTPVATMTPANETCQGSCGKAFPAAVGGEDK